MMTTDSRHVYDATLEANSDRKSFFASSSLVTATGFFRLHDLYNTLINNVLPSLSNVNSLRIWSAGCSDGREPYSIALATQRWMDNGQQMAGHTYTVRASDITDDMIAIGERNRYEITGPEKVRLQNYNEYYSLSPKNEVLIAPVVRNRVKFIVEDIINHKALSKYHILVCTNVLFYYEMEYRKQIVEKLVQNLESRGFIYLESMGTRFMRTLGLERVSPGNHFFQRVS